MAAPEYNLPPEQNRTGDDRGEDRLPPRPPGLEVDFENLSPHFRQAAASLCARVCELEMVAHDNPIISLIILGKFLKQIDSREPPRAEREFNDLIVGIERAASQGLRISLFLQAAWDEQRAQGHADTQSVIKRADFLCRVAAATADNQIALAAACEQWESLSPLLWNQYAQDLAVTLYAVRPIANQPNPYIHIPERVCSLCYQSRSPIDLAPVERLLRYYANVPDFIDPIVNMYITITRGTASLSQTERQSFFGQLGNVIDELCNRPTRDLGIDPVPHNLLLVLSDTIQEPGRAAHIEELLSMYGSVVRQGFSISPRHFASAHALLGDPGVHQEAAKNFKIRLEAGQFKSSKEILEAALECGAHQSAEVVIRSGFVPSRHVTHLRECLTSRAMTDVTFRGPYAGIAAVYYERSLQVLDQDEILRLRIVSRDLNYHHGFGALAVEASMTPGERYSLLHRFVLDHADSRLVNLAPPGYVPEYALVVSNLEPERVFAAHGPDNDPFKPYTDAWPDYASILPNLDTQVFVVSRRFLAVYQADSVLPATLWWNDHFPSNTATVSHTAAPEALNILLELAPQVGIVAAIGELEKSGALIVRRMRTVFNDASRTTLDHWVYQTRALDLFRIAYSQWKKGQTLPKQFPLDPSARPSESSQDKEDDRVPSESHGNATTDSARMLHEAWRWHSLRAAGISNRERFPKLVVADTLDSWSEIDSPIVLDTYDMSLTVHGSLLGRLTPNKPRRAFRLWGEQVLPAAIDQQDALKELRFIFRNTKE